MAPESPSFRAFSFGRNVYVSYTRLKSCVSFTDVIGLEVLAVGSAIGPSVIVPVGCRVSLQWGWC